MTKAKDGINPRSSYKKEFIAQAKKLCVLGATDAEMADFFGVERRTLHSWRNRHKDFGAAITIGKEVADSRVERSLYQRAVGYTYTEQQAIKIKTGQHTEEVQIVEVERHMPPDTVATIFWLKNRKKKEWRDKQEVEVDAAVKHKIEVEFRTPG